MRRGLFFAAIVVSALLLAWAALWARPATPEHGVVPLRRTASPVPPEPVAVGRRVPVPEPVRDEAMDPRAVAPVEVAPPSFALHVRIHDVQGGAPLPDMTLFVAPSGTRPWSAPVGPDRRAITDAEGAAFLPGLDLRGPWDVYAYPFHPGYPDGARARLTGDARIGTLPAAPWASGPRPEARDLHVGVGARVVLRSALPAGIEARQVLFELRGVASALSSQIGGLTVFARGASAEDGSVVAQFSALTNSVRSPGMTVHAVTEDGRFGLRVRRDDRVLRSTVIEIDEPFEPRGNVRYDVVVQDPRGEPLTPLLTRRAARAVHLASTFRASTFRDSAFRDGLDEVSPDDSELVGHRVHVEGTIHEFRGLPLVPVEIGKVSGLTRLPLEFGGAARPAAAVQFEAATLVRVTPVHGTPTPISVRVNRIR